MPTVQQKAMIIEEAQNKLSSQMAGKKFEEDSIKVRKLNFENGGEEQNLAAKERAYTETE